MAIWPASIAAPRSRRNAARARADFEQAERITALDEILGEPEDGGGQVGVLAEPVEPGFDPRVGP